MDVVSNAVKEGLQSTPKYLPSWYKYDKQGSVYHAEGFHDPKYMFYRKRDETCILKKYISIHPAKECCVYKQLFGEVHYKCLSIQDFLDTMTSTVSLMDLGSGDSVLTQIIIDAILQKQPTLSYYPVDISAEFLEEACTRLKTTYGSSLEIVPTAGFFEDGFKYLSVNRDNDFIIYFNSIFNVGIDDQISLLESLANHMKGSDRLLVSIDVCDDKKTITEAYGNKGPVCHLQMNFLQRLNRDFCDGKLDLSKFSLEFQYIQNKDIGKSSYARPFFVSLTEQTVNLPGLDISVSFEKGEEMNLSHWGGLSHKYTLEQFTHISKRGGHSVADIWCDPLATGVIFCLQTAMKEMDGITAAASLDKRS